MCLGLMGCERLNVENVSLLEQDPNTVLLDKILTELKAISKVLDAQNS